MAVWTIEAEPIEELPGAGRLGRNIRRDSRSAAYPYQAPEGVIVTSKTWTRHIGILNQGDLGSCTGNFEVGALGTDPLFGALPAGHPVLDEALAVDIYSKAEIFDGGAGLPGEDNGSSGSSVCTVTKKMGLISGFTWCQDEAAALAALMAGPVGFGVNWYSSFDTPSSEGIVSLPATASIRGGHEIVAREVDATRNLVWCDNSWGSGWGLAGRFAFPYSILTRLLREQGDCAVPLPLTVPAPVPTPPPAPVPDVHVDVCDRQLNAAIPHGWLTTSHSGPTAQVAHAITAWKHAKGL